MNFNKIIDMIKLYPYKKEGILSSIQFLEIMQKELAKCYQKEQEKTK